MKIQSFETGLSDDHHLIYTILKAKFEKSKLKNLIYRNFKNFKIEQFKSNICNGIYNVKAHSIFENNFYFKQTRS